MEEYKELRKLVAESSSIVFFGGAGTSTESGIPDFRSAQGLFETQKGSRHAPEEILSRDFFLSDPQEFYRFYRAHMVHAEAKPNQAHRALAGLEQEGRLQAVVTQNIDGLHQMAGSRRVLELHGSIHRNYCMDCRKFFGLQAVLDAEETVPRCDTCGGIIKPDVVLYQEGLDEEVLREAVEAITAADMLIVAGTSLRVHPAAGLIRYYTGSKLVFINKSATPYDSVANYLVQDSIGKVLGIMGGSNEV
ncbi:NAD-dependent protein deacylase [Paenibacillus caseinilyticus]|uniref:NAD-dependent protein deacylase n=1 Tax=Paenibacillus caseinilyticus TaxID=3098138 RepID=UPI0022B87E7D|nr:NAD-dependent protein deacylase [Paenibacillus caseinilyticus]MCZ8519892.1 NAD-dependent protein deacylase [Paenibacillus caseinilyticus]